jgi:hypothetical protein
MPAERWAAYGATLRIEDAGRAAAAATEIPGGVYNVVSDGERIPNEASRTRPAGARVLTARSAGSKPNSCA